MAIRRAVRRVPVRTANVTPHVAQSGLAPPVQYDQLKKATQHPVAEGHDHPSILPDDGSGERGAAPIEREPDCRHPQAGTRFPGQSPGKRFESAGLTPYEPLPIVPVR